MAEGEQRVPRARQAKARLELGSSEKRGAFSIPSPQPLRALEAAKVACKAKREAKTAARATSAAAGRRAHRREARGFEQMLRQNAAMERLWSACTLQARGRGGVCNVPTDVLPGDAGGRSRLMVVPAGPIPVIKIGGKRAREALQLRCSCLTRCRLGQTCITSRRVPSFQRRLSTRDLHLSSI